MAPLFRIAVFLAIITLATASFEAAISRKDVRPVGEHRAVIPMVRCGGSATLVETRINDCTARPCTIKSTTVIEVEFIPQTTTTNPTMKISATAAGSPAEVVETILEGTMLADEPISLTVASMQGEILTNDLELKIEVINSRGALEICVRDDFKAAQGNTAAKIRTNGVVAVIATLLLGANRLFF